MSKFVDWIQPLAISNTLGNGWCVRIDGSDVFDDINQYGVKTRRSLQVASGLKSKGEARTAAIEWLNAQLAALEEPQS